MGNNIENEFVSYEQAVALSELGFDEDCVAYFEESNIIWHTQVNQSNLINGAVVAPLKQQVFRWFREKYNYYGLIEGGYDNGKNLFTYVIWRKSFDDCIDDYWNTYEEAENECISKLIELTKQQDNGN